MFHLSRRSTPEHPSPRLLAVPLLLALAGAGFAGPAFASPQVGSVSPTTITEGDTLVIQGSGFLPDPDRYSVVLRDGQGLLALGEVVAATPQGLTLTVHGIERGSTSAEVVVREGVSVPLVPSASGTAYPGMPIAVDAASWFHGSGVRIAEGPVTVLPPLTASPAPSPSTGRGIAKPDLEPDFELDPPTPICPGGRFRIDWPYGCKEISARVTIGGDDPFRPPPIRTKTLGSIFDSWQARLVLRLGDGQASLEAPAVADAIAAVASEYFAAFGVFAAVENDEANEANDDGSRKILVFGDRMTLESHAAVVSLVCESP